jgi:uncharacterized membrane protein YoaK (UPF0700 family)
MTSDRMKLQRNLPSRKTAYLLALSLAAGIIDATSYLGLGRVFTANMTGNTVLLGVALARGTGGDAACATETLAGFGLGAACGVASTRTDGPWPRRAAPAFAIEAAALAALLALWAVFGVHSLRYWLIAVAGAAMGAQSAAVRSSDVGGVNTTYMTGTLLNAIARLVLRARTGPERAEGPSLPGAAWATYAVGALGGAFAEKAWHSGAVAISLAIVCSIAVVAFRSARA